MKKVNDKGFSLVELIIVVAIMAILITVLVPQYIKYVERSRNATDMQNAGRLRRQSRPMRSIRTTLLPIGRRRIIGSL